MCPVTTTLLGWIWSEGSISVSIHKLNPLTSCELPKTVKGLRSWIGAYKHLKACIPQYSTLLADLETAVGGRDSHERIVWTEELKLAFLGAQSALKNPRSITIPRRSDQLIITTDGAVHNGGIGSVLYILRDGQMKIGGYYSAKLRTAQQRWLPCELEALAISASVNHWGKYIIESDHKTQVLTDSKPCIQACKKLNSGQLSASAWISTFLSTLSRYDISIQHLSGSSKLAAYYLSCSPVECEEANCQICEFVDEAEQSTVRNITVNDIRQGSQQMPYITSSTWKSTQRDCPSEWCTPI